MRFDGNSGRLWCHSPASRAERLRQSHLDCQQLLASIRLHGCGNHIWTASSVWMSRVKPAAWERVATHRSCKLSKAVVQVRFLFCAVHKCEILRAIQSNVVFCLEGRGPGGAAWHESAPLHTGGGRKGARPPSGEGAAHDVPLPQPAPRLQRPGGQLLKDSLPHVLRETCLSDGKVSLVCQIHLAERKGI